MYANKADIFITFYFSIGLYMKSIYTMRSRSFVLSILALILKVMVPCTRGIVHEESWNVCYCGDNRHYLVRLSPDSGLNQPLLLHLTDLSILMLELTLKNKVLCNSFSSMAINHNEYEQLLKFFYFSVLLKEKKQIWELIDLKTFKVILIPFSTGSFL